MSNTTINNSRALYTMGCSWFVSRLYHDRIDSLHLNWKNVEDLAVRSRPYSRFSEDYAQWLRYIIERADKKKLGSNEFGLSSDEVLEMAEKLLAVI